jgi:predicted Zn-dependent protease
MQALLGETPAQVGRGNRSSVNGLETATLPARAQTQSGQVVDVVVTAYRVGESAYHFVTLGPAGSSEAFSPLVRSFRTLSDAEAAALRPRQIEVVEVGPRDTVDSLAARMAFDDHKLERFLTLNGKAQGAGVRPGELVKIVRFQR